MWPDVSCLFYFIMKQNAFFTLRARAAPRNLAEVRMNEADKQERDSFYKVILFESQKPLLCHYILLLSIRDSYEAPFKRITQLLVQVHKLGSVIG